MARRDTNTKQQTISITALDLMSVMPVDDFAQRQEHAIPMEMQASGYGMGEPIPSDYRTHPVVLPKVTAEASRIINIEHNKIHKRNNNYETNNE